MQQTDIVIIGSQQIEGFAFATGDERLDLYRCTTEQMTIDRGCIWNKVGMAQ